jgi:hypothetical protein
VVLSKFGKLETSGGGLAAAFRAGTAAGKPVVTTVSLGTLPASTERRKRGLIVWISWNFLSSG